MDRKKLGFKGEQLAHKYLLTEGYEIVAQNWRAGRIEIDLIAKKEDVLIFIEVKTRSSSYYENPEDAVNPKKQQRIVKAAEAFMHEVDHQWEVRFDIISIIFTNEDSYQLRHLNDAYFPKWN